MVYGQFLSGTPQTIVFQDENGTRRSFDIHQVVTIDFDAISGRSSDSGALDQHPPDSSQYSTGDRDRQDGARSAVLPPEAQITVRTAQDIHSQAAKEEQVYPASTTQDVLDRTGRVVIPRGCQATLAIRRINEGGALNKGSLVLELDVVRVNGRTYRLSSDGSRSSDANDLGNKTRTGEMAAAEAATGNLLGAPSAGGADVSTKGHEIRVSAETILTFRLDRSMELREIKEAR